MNAKILEVRPDRVRAAVDAGHGAGGRRLPGRVHRPRRDLPRPGRLRHHGRGTGRGARRRCLRALHRRVGRVHHRPPGRARRPQDGPHLVRRAARDDRDRLPQAGDALGRVRPHARGAQLHVRSAFTWEPGTWVTEEEPDMEERDHLGRSTHDTSEAKVTITGVPDRPGIAASAVPGASPIADVNVDMIVQNVSERRGHRHLVHRARRGPRQRASRRSRSSRPRSAPPASPPTRASPGSARRRRHEVQPGRGGHHVRDPGGRTASTSR